MQTPTPKCLLIDDNHEYLETIALGLAQHEITNITKLSDSAQAMECLVEHHEQGAPFDMVITDNFMPTINGHELMLTCRKHPHLEQLPFIIMTGDPDNLPAKECFTGESVANEYIIKPFNIVHLVRKINALYSISKSEEQGFCPIRVSTLFIDQKIPFDIFLDHYNQYRLLLKKGDLFTEKHLFLLKGHNTKKLYISSASEKEYQQYLESNLEESFTHINRTAVDHAEIISEYGVHILQSEFSDPNNISFDQLGKVSKGLQSFLNQDTIERVSSLFQLDSEINIHQKSLNVASLALLLANKIAAFEEEEIHKNITAPFQGLFELGSKSLKILLESSLLHQVGFSGDGLSEPVSEQNRNTAISILKNLPQIDPKIVEIISQQDEFCDGSGTPQGLKKNNINIFSQMLCFSKHLECQLAQSDGNFDTIIKYFDKNVHLYNARLVDLLKLIITH